MAGEKHGATIRAPWRNDREQNSMRISRHTAHVPSSQKTRRCRNISSGAALRNTVVNLNPPPAAAAADAADSTPLSVSGPLPSAPASAPPPSTAAPAPSIHFVRCDPYHPRNPPHQHPERQGFARPRSPFDQEGSALNRSPHSHQTPCPTAALVPDLKIPQYFPLPVPNFREDPT